MFESSKTTDEETPGKSCSAIIGVCEDAPPLIHVLPNEILLHVFSNLTIFETKTNVALVCKRWKYVSESPSLQDALYFGPSQSTETVLKVLQGSPMLKKLTLYSRSDVNDLLREASTSNGKLTCLKITSSKEGRYTELETDILLELLRSCRQLRYLTLKRVALDNPDLAFRELGPSAQKLVGLNVNHNIQLDTQALHQLVAGLPKLKDFRVYCLSYNRIGSVTPYTDTPIEELMMKMGDTLECLKLNMLGLTDSVMPLLATMSGISVLHLYRLINVQDEAFLLLSRLNGLRKFVVTVPRTITSGCLSQVLGCPGFGQLSLITISNSYSLDDNVLRVIGSNCPHLTDISLPGCRRITDSGITHIIRNCRQILRMNLFSTRSVVSHSFIIIPHYLPDMELLIYKPVDCGYFVLPPELEAMPKLTVRTVYRYL